MEQRQYAQPTIPSIKGPHLTGLSGRSSELRLSQHGATGVATYGSSEKHDDTKLGSILPWHCRDILLTDADQADPNRRGQLHFLDARHALGPHRAPQGCMVRIYDHK
jgi:hypothetical protein